MKIFSGGYSKKLRRLFVFIVLIAAQSAAQDRTNALWTHIPPAVRRSSPESSAGFDETTGWDPAPLKVHVAAIINWYGITDVADLLEGPNFQQYAGAWLGSQLHRKEMAKAVSPLTHVKISSPPVFTIHGDKDQLVPYQHAVRLHESLQKAGVKNEFVTIPGGRHGGFSKEDMFSIQDRNRKFLKEVGVM